MRKTLTVVCVILVLIFMLGGCTEEEPEPIVGVIVEKVTEKKFDFILSELAGHDVYTNGYFFIVKHEDDSVKKVKVQEEEYYQYEIGSEYTYY